MALGYTKDILGLEPFGEKWKSFGWNVNEIDGHNYEQIFDSLSSLSHEKPNVVVLHTVKGKGVSFMEDQLLWHYRAAFILLIILIFILLSPLSH